MKIQFEKWHGIGNDFILIDNRDNTHLLEPDQIRFLCDRHFGIGADAVIFYEESAIAAAKMNYFNADGSASQTCGNGLRVMAAYGKQHGYLNQSTGAIERPDGNVSQYQILAEQPFEISIDMGAAVWQSVTDFPDDCQNQTIQAGKNEYQVSCISMGNPHAVLFVDTFTGLDLETIGRDIEQHPLFPNRINVGFVQPLSATEANYRVWERGVGCTLACGSGASAAAVAGIRAGIFNPDSNLLFHLAGGDLQLRWDQDQNRVFKTGAAKYVFRGELSL